MIIAHSGTHGTGKTTAVYAMAAAIKKRIRGEVGIVLETARRCPFSIFRPGQTPTAQAQMWIFAEQIRAELEASRRYAVVITDRTIVDCIAYSSAAGFHSLAYGQIKLARFHVGLYKHVIFHGSLDNPYCTPDPDRHQDQKLRLEVERRMLEIYSQLDVKLIRRPNR